MTTFNSQDAKDANDAMGQDPLAEPAQAMKEIAIDVDEFSIQASLVPEHQRMDFLPRHFGRRHLLVGEAHVYGWMDRLCTTQRGGYWEFYELSNGGFYLAPRPLPEQAPHLHLRVDGNGFDGDMSVDAAGIVATLFALNYMMFGGASDLTQAYEQLLDYAAQHPESALIDAAID